MLLHEARVSRSKFAITSYRGEPALKFEGVIGSSGIIRTYRRYARTPETHYATPWVRYTSHFAHTFQLFATDWCRAGYVDSVRVAVQGTSNVASKMNLGRTIPYPPLGQTAKPSAMTPHCTTSHRITAHCTAQRLTRTHEFFAPVLPSVKSCMELVAKKFGETKPIALPLDHRFESRAESNFKFHLR